MKKTLLIAGLAVVTAAVTADANPRFGAIVRTAGGSIASQVNPSDATGINDLQIGGYVSADNFTASLTLQNATQEIDGSSTEPSVTGIDLGVNYKTALTSETAATIGVSFETASGDDVTVGNSTADIDSASRFALNAGIEHMFTDNLAGVVQVAVYESSTLELDGGAEVTETGFLNSATFGLALLF